MLSNWLTAIHDRAASIPGDFYRQRFQLGAFQRASEAFLEFHHRFWFTGVSSQQQATELYALMRQQAGLDTLFKEVAEETRTADEYQRNIYSRRLQTWGAVFAIGSIALAILGLVRG